MINEFMKDSRLDQFPVFRRFIVPALALVLASNFLFANIALSSPSAIRTKKTTLDLMSYNVENLFDTKHDEGKDDWTFLPKNYPGKKEGCANASTPYYRSECYRTDWTEEKLALKIQQIKKLVMAGRTKLPDVLSLIEVENENVVSQLAQALGYKNFFVTNSPDERGIDVALLYNENENFKQIDHTEFNLYQRHILNNRTRNILEVVFQVRNGETLSIFVNHWPSQGNPTSDRMAVSNFLSNEIAQRMSLPQRHVVSLGDYNTLDSNTPNPIKDLTEGDNHLVDLHDEFLKDVPGGASLLARGTHYYSKEHSWSFLDKILVSPELVTDCESTVKIEINSFDVHHPAFATVGGQNNDQNIQNDESDKTKQSNFSSQKSATRFQALYENDIASGLSDPAPREERKAAKKESGIPHRYNFDTLDALQAGFSDHFALKVSLSI